MAHPTDTLPASARDLAAKYGDDLLDHPPLITRERFVEKIAERDAIDQHFTRISMEFLSHVNRREGLDQRSRFLIQIGQFAVSKSHDHLRDALRAAIGIGVPPREALESILLTQIYSGYTVMDPALTIFVEIAREAGILDSLRDGQLPLDGHDQERDLDAERATWPPAVAQDPRRERLMERYGWRGVSTGIRYREVTHLDVLEKFDAEDPEFAAMWMDFTYLGMYSRWILDDKTRLLCTTGDCLALGAAGAASARDHMQEALHFGNTPREILDMIHMSGLAFGFPGMTAARGVLMSILKEEGRLSELGMTPADRA